MACCARCREGLGPDRVLAVKLNVSDFSGPDGVDEAACAEIVEALDADASRVDLVELSGGTYASGMACLGDAADFRLESRVRFAPHARRLRARLPGLKLALMVTGGVDSRDAAVEALADADVAGVARAACVDPTAAAKWLLSEPAVSLKPPRPLPWLATIFGGRRSYSRPSVRLGRRVLQEHDASSPTLQRVAAPVLPAVQRRKK